jgi:hypothetical protein
MPRLMEILGRAHSRSPIRSNATPIR